MDDRFLPLAFSLSSSPGAYAVLAGAGVSTGAGVKSAWGIVVDLVQRIAESQGEDPAAITAETAAAWYENRFGRSADYSTVVEQLGLTPIARQALLRGYFEPSGQPVQPSQAHRASSSISRNVLTYTVIR